MKISKKGAHRKFPKILVALVMVVSFFALLLVYKIHQEILEDNGRAYRSKANFCRLMAQSYLKTMQKTENITDFGSDRWLMAIDVESDMYNLCLVELNSESLKDYNLKNLEKYQ